ncbi:MAG TPA: methyltransferase [Stellaceae bacterium]|nr:methyltransferase [Stellaceae bacterium]
MSVSDDGMPLSEDTLLGGRVRIRQPFDGARASIDPVFLAAAVPVGPGEVVLDIGCGTGAAMLCVAAREPQCRVVGLERQRELVRIAGDNAILNGMAARVSVMVGDLLQPPPRISAGAFDHVFANPPYLERGRANETPNPARAEATIEGDAELGDWIRFALSMVKSKGTVTLIHRADRIDAVLGQIAGRAGEVVVYPLWPGLGKPASRILVRARKQAAAAARLAVGMVLHETDGRFTQAAEAVLRGGEALVL